MAKHTQGPWGVNKYRATQDTENHVVQARANDDGRPVTVATVYPVSDDGQEGGESHANALLIAAAPDMWRALQVFTLTPLIAEWLRVADPKALEQAERAIRKSEGRV